MKKILLITNIFPPLIGGPATFIDRMAHYLAEKGIRVTVVCSSIRDKDPSDTERPFRVVRVAVKRREIYEMKIRWILFKEMSAHRNILVNGLETYVSQISDWLNRPYVIKIVGDPVWETARNQGQTSLNIDQFQEQTVTDMWNSLILRRNQYIHRARKVITPSEYLRSMVIGWGIEPQKVHTVLNGVDLQNFEQIQPVRRYADENLRLIFIGRLTNWKGVETILLALQELSDVNLTVIGDGPEYPHLLELSRQLKLQDRVCFTGRLGQQEIRKHMSNAHALILTSLYEGLSHTLLEAGASGLPCIASDCGGNGEVIVSGENGLLVPPQDVSHLRSAIKKIQADEVLRYNMAVKSKEIVKQFDLRNTVDKACEILLNSAM